MTAPHSISSGSIEPLARKLCELDGWNPDATGAFGVKVIREGRLTDTGHDTRKGAVENIEAPLMWTMYVHKARDLQKFLSSDGRTDEAKAREAEQNVVGGASGVADDHELQSQTGVGSERSSPSETTRTPALPSGEVEYWGLVPKCKLCGLEDGACICAHISPQAQATTPPFARWADTIEAASLAISPKGSEALNALAAEVRAGGAAQGVPEPEAYRETVRQIAAVREKRMAEMREALERIRNFPHDKTACEQAMSQIAGEALAVSSTMPLPATEPPIIDVVRDWCELYLSEKRAIAADLGLAPQGKSSDLEWTKLVLYTAKEAGELPRVAKAIADVLARRASAHSSTQDRSAAK